MAINSFEPGDKISPICVSSSSHKGDYLSPHLVKLDYITNETVSSAAASNYLKSRQKNHKPPYFASDGVHLFSQMIEKRTIHKKGTDLVSSLPLAASIYKANSDDLRSVKKCKKTKKSVLTLPNEQASLPQSCTVSDMNDSEYLNHENESHNKKTRKSRIIQNNKKIRNRKKEYEVFDRDKKYCTQLNISLDGSSTDVIKHFNSGSNSKAKRSFQYHKDANDKEFKAHDVWAVLRNINRFQFLPSPPMSENSVLSFNKKKRFNRRRDNRKDTRYTCHTEEFAYISSIEVDSKSINTFSQSSSLDRITVIDKNDELGNFCEDFVRQTIKSNENSIKGNNYKEIPPKNINQINKSKNKPYISKVFNSSDGQMALINRIEGTNDTDKTNKNIKETQFEKSGENKKCFTSKENNNSSKNTDKLSPYHNIRAKPNKILHLKSSNNNLRCKPYNTDQSKSNNVQISFLKSNNCGQSYLSNHTHKESDSRKPYKLSSNESSQKLSGITKEVTDNGQKVVSSKEPDIMKRKPRLVTTMPSTVEASKLTKIEIRRRLPAAQKRIINTTENNRELSSECNNKAKVNTFNDQILQTKAPIYKEKNNDNLMKYKNLEMQSLSKNINTKQPQPKHTRPTRQLKDKTLKLLYKKSSVRSLVGSKIGGQGDVNNFTNVSETKSRSLGSQADTTKLIRHTSPIYRCGKHIGIPKRLKSPRQRSYQNPILNLDEEYLTTPSLSKKVMSNSTKYPWVKAKRVSDFIENIIKKINNGVYYNQENIGYIIMKECKETAAQTSTHGAHTLNTIDIDLNNLIKYKNIERQSLSKNVNSKYPQSKHTKPIRQLKDKTLKLLYKKSSVQVGNKIGEQGDVNNFTNPNETKYRSIGSQADNSKLIRPTSPIYRCGKHIGSRRLKSPRQRNYQSAILNLNEEYLTTPSLTKKIISNTMKYPWAKAKRVSDFIENIIKKINNGIYYNKENVGYIIMKECKETAVQTSIHGAHILNTIDKDLNTDNAFKVIPGFDETLPELEIKTLNVNQIAVKHCVTNVVLQFDVRVPGEPNAARMKCSSCVPIKITDSNTKIYKCKTSILNAMLPAELCSILPKMMQHIMSNAKNHQKSILPSLLPNNKTVPPFLMEKTSSYLSVISEISQCENQDAYKFILSPLITTSSIVTPWSQGDFSSNLRPAKILPKKVSHSLFLTESMLPKIQFNIIWFCLTMPRSLIIPDQKWKFENPSYSLKDSRFRQKKLRCCTVLQPYYKRPSPRVTCIFNSYNYIDILQKIMSLNNLLPIVRSPELIYDLNSISLHVIMNHETGSTDSVTITIKKSRHQLCSRQSHTNGDLEKSTIMNDCKDFEFTRKAIEYIRPPCLNKETSRKDNLYSLYCNKIRGRNAFRKLYKKCKSTSNISGEKCTTSLTKISNLDDFFQVLGSGKTAVNVFDGFIEKNILSAIMDMKSWITDLSQRQAMLVLLLLNKKQTPNLNRFRAILLQGIAVNRITRASELDMEVEVIERENLSTLSQFDGITYLPISNENYNNLLEELYWIAKTTASDYQRPFDESSEKHLRNLLERRKKWNPSYLRLMARYVGLGLLKSPK